MWGNDFVINFYVEHRKILISFYTLLLFTLHGLNIFVMYYMIEKLNIKEPYITYYFINEGSNLYTLCNSIYFLIKWTRDLLDYNITVTIVKGIIDIVFLIINMCLSRADKIISYCMLGYCIVSIINIYIISKMECYFMRLSRPSRSRRRSRKVHPSYDKNKEITIIISDFNYECKNHSEECENCLCSICLEEMNNKIVHSTKCNHTFHKDCIVEYTRRIDEENYNINIKCPNCREVIFSK